MKGEAALAQGGCSFIVCSSSASVRLFGQLPVNLILFSAAVAQAVFVFRNGLTGREQTHPKLAFRPPAAFHMTFKFNRVWIEVRKSDPCCVEVPQKPTDKLCGARSGSLVCFAFVHPMIDKEPKKNHGHRRRRAAFSLCLYLSLSGTSDGERTSENRVRFHSGSCCVGGRLSLVW